MATYTNDILFIQALDSYSYDLEQCVEKLQYILGGNDHAGANNLMGRIYHEQLRNFKNAREYYHRALCIDHEYVETYYYYPFFSLIFAIIKKHYMYSRLVLHYHKQKKLACTL